MAQRTLRLPGLRIEQDVAVAMRDGVRLATDVYLPEDGGPWPALLMRTPYGKGDVINQGYGHAVWYASHGYAVISQDVRGRWASEGVFTPYVDEPEDGADTVAWAVAQPWCDGSVGMYGFSYPGATQLLCAGAAPAGLKAICPGMTCPGYGEGWTFQNGALKHAFILTWALELGRDQALRAGDLAAMAELDALLARPAALFATLPVRSALPAHLRRHAPYLQEWLERRDDAAYWQRTAPAGRYGRMSTAGLHIAGWYDVFLEGTLENFAALRRQGRAPQHLLVGPWYHMPWARHVGAMDFGPAGANVVDEAQLRFFERYLRGADNGLDREAPVRLFLMGANQWLAESDWPLPDARTLALHLASDGRACSINGTGRLQPAPVQGEAVPDAFPANPHIPVFSLGGRSCCFAETTPMGPADQRPQEIRNDMLVFDGEVLEAPLTVIGAPVARLFVATDGPSCDFVARLVDVHPDGRAINVSDGILRLRPAAAGVSEIAVPMSPTANRFAAGHRLRLEVTGSDFPVHDRNPNSGVDPLDATAADFRVATHFVFHDARFPSRLELPVVRR